MPIFLIVFPYYLVRMIRRGGYGKDFRHRFGLMKDLGESNGKRIWIQAVSVGEIEGLRSLIEMLCADGYEVVVTTTTSTGYKILREKYGSKCYYVGIFPIDFFIFSKLAWRRIKPDIIVLMEGEMWPEHLHLSKLGCKASILLNARLSDKTYFRYRRIKWVARRLYNKLWKIGVSNEEDYKRFLALGVDEDRLELTGNIKFDSTAEEFLSEEEKSKMKEEFGFRKDSKILLGSSTWAGEEGMLIEVIKEMKGYGDYRLLLVPRHVERRREIISKLISSGEIFSVRSENKKGRENSLIYLADTTGELKVLTQLGDFAFIGKSLFGNTGGQTPIESASSGVPMVYGNAMTNFRVICDSLERDGASLRAKDEFEAKEYLIGMGRDEEKRKAMSDRCKDWYRKNVGATRRSMELIREVEELKKVKKVCN